MILVVNLNLAVDVIVHLDGLTPGQVHRSEQVERLAGGKGVNVARVLKTLNEPALLTGFLGGRAGGFIAGELQREEIPFDCTAIRNESRTCIILDDCATRTQTVVNEAGPEISEGEWQEFAALYARLLRSSEMVVITGSLPTTLAAAVYSRLISTANEMSRPVLLDTSSDALRCGVGARPFFVKINGREAGELLKVQVNDFEEAKEAAGQLREMGARHAMITLGAQGALLNFDGCVYGIESPRVEARNSVGSGDAVTAGIAAGLMRGLAAEELAGLAIAAGAANALRGAGRCEAHDIIELAKGVSLFRL